MTSPTLLIFQDSEEFGGHEAMFLQFLPAIVRSGVFKRIVVRHPATNTRFAERLKPFVSPSFEALGWAFTKRRAEPYLAWFRLRYKAAVRKLLAKEQPAVTLLLQGRIENCAVPLLASKSGTTVSYLPMAHRMAELGRASFPGDLVRRVLYRRPDRIIVPGKAVAGQVSAAGSRGTAFVAENVVSPPPRVDRMSARAEFGVQDQKPIALILGRMETRQKGLDRLFEAIRSDADRLGNWTFLFIGSGDAEAAAQQLAGDLAGRVDVRCLSWTDQPHLALSAADLLLMPSRWEGVPLVLLEALTYGLPVLGSNIDVFRQFLPEANITDFERRRLSDAMSRALESDCVDKFRTRSADILANCSLDRSSRIFVQALSEGTA